MRYLYGDSSESSLKINYIDYLKDSLDVAVAMLLSHQRLAQWRESRRERQASADADTEQLRSLGVGMEEALTSLMVDVKDTSAPGRAAASMRQTFEAAILKEIAVVDSGLQDDLRRIGDHIVQEGKTCYAALEVFLLGNDLPQVDRRIHVTVSEKAYSAIRTTSALGLDATVTLSVPPENMFTKTLRISDITQSLEIHAPTEKGLLLKKVKLVAQKLHKHYVTAVEITEHGTTLQLRAQPDPMDKGWDIDLISDDTVTVTRVNKDGTEDEAFEPAAEDVGRLRALEKELMAGVDELLRHRTALRNAVLDGTDVAKHENPGLLVKRMIGAMAPIVQEISRRSPVDGELILKRVVDSDRREEILVRSAELEQKLSRLAPSMRALFRQFGLARDVADEAETPIEDDWLEEVEA